MKLGHALEALQRSELVLAEQLRAVAERHMDEVDVHHLAKSLADQCDEHARRLGPMVERYEAKGGEDELLSDLQELFLATQRTLISWTQVGQAAQAVRDEELSKATTELSAETELQTKWLVTKLKESAPQALTS